MPTRLPRGPEHWLDRATPRVRLLAAPAPEPALESFADNLYGALEPLAWLDADVGWSLAHFCAALGAMFQPIEDLARDTPDGPGWSSVVDLDRCPDDWLPWLAQLVGVTVVPGSTPEEMRARIASTDGFKRGTPEAIKSAAQATLTGSKTVYLRERSTNGSDPPYTLEVVTLTSETPNSTNTRNAILAQKPGGLVLIYNTVVGWDYTAMTTAGGTYATLATNYATYSALAANQQG